MDNFIVSARKYRPVTFESVVGQLHITSTLRNAIARGQLAHAYLFCGPRGVGKTTCARIFAKAINCLNPQGSESCGECESCRAFNEGRSFNIHELDAASNNSVDDIRSLTEQVRIPPQIGRYSVYIIDEVHMLSSAAFNAFLKTLEEPPAHAIFILATTEKHKIIPTILSRCQIYDFNRIRVEDGVQYLKYIASSEGIVYDDESLNLIAAKADGGMRDALSMFDKAVAFCGKSLDFREVARTLNVLDYDTYFNITQIAAHGDYKSALLIFDEVLRKGFSAQTFVGGLAIHLRDLLMCKDTSTVPLLEVTGTLLERYKAQSAELDTGFLFDAVALINAADSTLRSATNSRLHIELGLMKLCGLGQKKNRLEPNEAKLPELTGGLTAAGNTKVTPVPVLATAYPETIDPKPLPPAQSQRVDPDSDPVTSTDDGVKLPTAHKTADGQEHSDVVDNHIKSSEPQHSLPKQKTAESAHGIDSEVSREDKSEINSTIKTASITGRTISGVSINSILKGGGMLKSDDSANERQVVAPRQESDPECEQKIMAVRDSFIEELSRNRPRFATAFSRMMVKENKISITVSTDLLKDDIVQNQREVISLLRELSGVDCNILLDVTVMEDKGAVRPIKPEDKLAHLRSKNNALDELRRELGLELE